MLRLITLCTVAALFAPVAHAAPASFDSTAAVALLRAHALPIRLEGGELRGAGGDSLRQAAAHSRFVLVGEPHGFVEPPRISAALFRALRAGGPAHLAIETGPVSARTIDRMARAHDAVDAFRAFDRTYPWGLPFYHWREEAEMAADVAHAGGDLWGLDQEFMESPAIHLDALARSARTPAARALATRCLADAREGSRRMVADKNPNASWLVAAPDSTFDALARAFQGDATAQGTLDELRQSRAIYLAWFRGDALANNAVRARLMKRHLGERLAQARAHGEAAPRVLFKFGYEHLFRGRSLMDTYEVGNTAWELAEQDGSAALALLVLPLGGTQNAFRPFGGSPADTAAAYDPHADFDWLAAGPFAAAAGAGDDDWTLVDLRPLRAHLPGAAATGLPRGLARLAWSYDAVLVVPRGHAAQLLVP